MLEKMVAVIGNSADVAIRYQIQKELMKQSLLDREERQKLIDDVCEAVLARMSIRIEAEAISQLRDLLNGFGRY